MPPRKAIKTTMNLKPIFDQDCRQCKRLNDFLCAVKQKHPDYHARPVAPFGDANAELLIVGLGVCLTYNSLNNNNFSF